MKRIFTVLIGLIFCLMLSAQNEYKYEVKAYGGLRVGGTWSTKVPASALKIDSIVVSSGNIWFFSGGDTLSPGVSGVSIDTTSLSDRIDLKVSISDTTTMLGHYIARSDTASMLTTYINKADTATMLSHYIDRADTASMLSHYALLSEMGTGDLSASDTATMLSPYALLSEISATEGISASDTSDMLSPYALLSEIGSAEGISAADTADMLLPYSTILEAQDIVNDSLTARLTAASVGISRVDSTGNAVGNYVTRKALVDSLAANVPTGVVLYTDTATMLTPYLLASEYTSGSVYDTTYLYLVIDSLKTRATNLESTLDNILAYLGNDIDVTSPLFLSAELGTYNDSILVVLFDTLDVQQDSIPNVADFYLTEDGDEMGIQEIDISSDTLFIALDSLGVNGATYLLDYTSDFPALQDSSGNKVVNWNNKAVTNNIEAAASSTLLTDILAYWKLDETTGVAVDEVGSADLTVDGATQTVGGLVFDGTNDFAGSIDATFEIQTMTVSAWVTTTQTGETSGIVDNYYWSGDGWSLEIGGEWDNDGLAVFHLNDGSNELNLYTYPGGTAINDGDEHILIATFDGSNAYLYVDGELEATSAWAHTITYDAANRFTLGSRSAGGQLYFAGTIRNVGVWTKVVSSDERTDLQTLTYPFE